MMMTGSLLTLGLLCASTLHIFCFEDRGRTIAESGGFKPTSTGDTISPDPPFPLGRISEAASSQFDRPVVRKLLASSKSDEAAEKTSTECALKSLIMDSTSDTFWCKLRSEVEYSEDGLTADEIQQYLVDDWSGCGGGMSTAFVGMQVVDAAPFEEMMKTEKKQMLADVCKN